jgi:hypothetical protein
MSDERLEILLEWSFGFALLAVFWMLAHNIGLQVVEEKTSFGLPIILNSLSSLGGAWGGIIVSRRKDRNVLPFPRPKNGAPGATAPAGSDTAAAA